MKRSQDGVVSSVWTLKDLPLKSKPRFENITSPRGRLGRRPQPQSGFVRLWIVR